MFGQSDPHVMIPASRDPVAALGPIAAEIETLFRSKAAAAGVPVEWSTAMTVNDTELVKRLLFAARNADLTILGQHDARAHDVSTPSDLVEQIVLNSGRPVLVIPYAGRFASIGERVMVAWNAGREAARALHDAMPFLARAKHVILIAINPDIGTQGVRRGAVRADAASSRRARRRGRGGGAVGRRRPRHGHASVAVDRRRRSTCW